MEVTKSKIEKALNIEHPDLSQITDDLYLSSLPKKNMWNIYYLWAFAWLSQ